MHVEPQQRPAAMLHPTTSRNRSCLDKFSLARHHRITQFMSFSLFFSLSGYGAQHGDWLYSTLKPQELQYRTTMEIKHYILHRPLHRPIFSLSLCHKCPSAL